MGTLGQKCFTSGVHFSGMFSEQHDKGHNQDCVYIQVSNPVTKHLCMYKLLRTKLISPLHYFGSIVH